MTLSMGEPSMLLLCEAGPPPYHHRILMCRLREATWIVATPEGDLQVDELSEFQIFPLMRAEAIPKIAEAAGCHLFQGAVDEEPHGWHAQAAPLALVRGAGAPTRRRGPCLRRGGSPIPAARNESAKSPATSSSTWPPE